MIHGSTQSRQYRFRTPGRYTHLYLLWNPKLRTLFVHRLLTLLLCSLVAAPLAAQVPSAEYAARRDSLAAAMTDGVLIALGGHEPAEDFLNFYPVPSFYYLT